MGHLQMLLLMCLPTLAAWYYWMTQLALVKVHQKPKALCSV